MKKRESTANTLSEKRIIQHALEIVDQEGLDKLSMRRLAISLQSDPMAVYYYFKSKNNLLDGIAEHLEGLGFPPDTSAGSWQDHIRQFAHNQLNVAIKHPNAVPIFALRPSLNPTTREYQQWIAERLSDGKVEGKQGLRMIIASLNGVLLYFHARSKVNDPLNIKNSRQLMDSIMSAICNELS